jgi:hypothetical protein
VKLRLCQHDDAVASELPQPSGCDVLAADRIGLMTVDQLVDGRLTTPPRSATGNDALPGADECEL